MMSLKSTINLSLLAEEVVESVFAGFYFQQMSVRQMSNKTGQFADSAGNSKLDTMRDMDDLGSVDQSGPQELTAKVGDVYVFLMIDPNCCWTFYAEGGALRRIIMNIFGNSLKYTHRGAITVSITQASTRKDSTKGPNRVIITVSDTGIGMRQDFLDNHLFEPFSQENSISPGTGLGLSIVKKIVSQQRGRISVKSHLGVGTSVIVTLPLRPQGGPAADGNKALNQALASFNADVHELRNLRVRLVGFQSSTLATWDAVDVEGQTFDSLSLLQNVCADWLKLEVISEADKETIMPDLVILSEETHINQTNEKDLISIPTVVVCRNALVAYQYTNAYRLENRYDQFDRVLEFISQPIGPHKLAKILLLVFSRWQSIRDGSSDGLLSHGIGTPPSENEPAQPFTPPLLSAVSNLRDAKDTAPPEETQIVEPSDSGPPAATSLPRRPGVSRTSPKPQQSFLLVDDNAINLKILSTYVKKLSRKLSTATNGEEALNSYKKTPAAYSCIFMDISMPVMDGLEATRAIRTYEREQKRDPVLIVALTGLASSETQQEAFTSGVDLFLTKPVKLKELSSVLRSQSLLADE